MADQEAAHANARARNLVVLIDGTWISPIHRPIGLQQSNVFWLNLFLESQNHEGEAQVAFYHPGIGSAVSDAEKWLEGGLALGLERYVEAAYLDIVANYHMADGNAEASLGSSENSTDGSSKNSDKIYIIGFSRGAVVATAVASLISKFGVLNPLYIQHYKDLWRHAKGEDTDNDVNAIKQNCCRDAKVEFLGLFDTVPGAWADGSSQENRVIKETFFRNRKLPRNIKRALHILSMDESRIAFRNLEFEGVEDASEQNLEQIWMPGVHSDIGGGYEEDLLSNIALITMIDRLKSDLNLDNGRLDPLKQNIKLQFPTTDKIYIHDEFGRGIFRRLFSAALGYFVKKSRTPTSADGSYHELCKRIENRLIRMKSNRENIIFHLNDYMAKGWPKMSFAEVKLLGECLDPLQERRLFSGSGLQPRHDR